MKHAHISAAINAIHPQRCSCERCDPVRVMNARAVVRSAMFGGTAIVVLFWGLWTMTPQ